MSTRIGIKKTSVLPNEPASVLVIIPAYNEEDCIADVVSEVRRSRIGQVLVIDDGSIDHTASKAREAGADVLPLPYNLGIGGAVQAGFKFAVQMGYQYVVRLDGDGQHKVAEVHKLLDLVQSNQADVAIGSRFYPNQHTYSPPFFRAIGIRWFATIVSWITKEVVSDTTSGMQALNKRALEVLARNYPQDYPEVEARILLHKAKLRCFEVSVTMRPRLTGVSSITPLRSIYYAFKVSLATWMAALRQAPVQYN